MDVETALRELLTDDRLDVPVRPGAVDAVHHGVRRRRRSRAALTAASTVVVTVLAIGGVVLASGPAGFDTVQPGGDDHPTAAPTDYGKPTPATEPTADNEIAWNPIAYDVTKPFALPGTTPDPSVPWCGPKDVTVSATEFQGATGSAAGSVIVTNDGAACGLQGSPSVTGYAGDRVVAEPRGVDAFLVHPWITLQPGRSARSIVQIFGDASSCSDPIDRFEVDLGHGPGAAPVEAGWSGGGPVRPRCGTVPKAQRLDHYVVSAGAWTTPDGGPRLPMQDLASTTSGAPASVMQGTTIRYQVVLATHGADLDPCPPYREQLVSTDGTATAYATSYYLLDCTAMSQVDASTYRLDMKLTMPGDVPPGDYVLEWRTPIPGVYTEDDPTVRVTAAPPPCRQQQLAFRPGRAGAGMTHYAQIVIITNVSRAECSLRGYPGVEFVDASGAALPTKPAHGSSYFWTVDGYETVPLSPGGEVSFGLAGSDYDARQQRSCDEAAGIKVIAPGLAEQVLVHAGWPYCYHGAVDVSPVVPGGTGP